MSPIKDKRLEFLTLAFDQLDKPYVWGADGPDAFDCSGLICWLLKELDICDWRSTHNAQRIFDSLQPTEAPRPGDLVFYGPSPLHIEHVMIHWGDGRVIGACGGNRDVTSIEIARKKNALVRFKPRRGYRPDFVGYRVAPVGPPKGSP
jgi:cell wall-associated NlpC family hydrolase